MATAHAITTVNLIFLSLLIPSRWLRRSGLPNPYRMFAKFFMQTPPLSKKLACIACWVFFLLASLAGDASAQSTDLASPSAVRTNEVLGKIVARDIGDPRLTDHFYAFTGTPGDLLITVEGQNLNGDIDVFSASGLRPLLKFTIYAGSSSPITKSIYLRKREDLILRVEARTPNDDEGSYRLHFGGAFEPITSGPLVAEGETNPTEPSSSAASSEPKKGRRVSSVGARLPEPPAEVAAAPTPEETAAPSESEEPKTVSEAPVKKGGRGRAGRKTKVPEAEVSEEPSAKTGTEENPPTEDAPVTKSKTPSGKRRSTRRSTTSRPVSKAPPETTTEAEAEPESGPRLIIETTDGTLINRYMSSVRRVTVENGKVVVIGKDGKIERFQLENVVRMTISP